MGAAAILIVVPGVGVVRGIVPIADVPDRQSGDGRPQRVVRREDAVIPVPVPPRLRDQIRKPSLKTSGWIDLGVGANNWGSPFNGPITFNARNWQVQMNQLDLVNEKVLDTEGGGFDWSAVPSDRMFCQGRHRLPCEDIGDVHSAAQATSRHPSAFT